MPFRRALLLIPTVLLPCHRRHVHTHSAISPHYGQACRPKRPAAGGACGEDACCITRLADGRLLLAVADGVGGWRKRGVDPSLFSNGLIQCLIAQCGEDDSRGATPQALLKKAFWRLVDLHLGKKLTATGSSTACIAIIDSQKQQLQVANVGDSGLLLIRDDQVVLKTDPQQSSYNAPLQLTIYPDGHVVDASPQADCLTIGLLRGDVVVLGSDGLFDNLFDSAVVQVVRQCKDPKRAAIALVDAAHSSSIRSDTSTPFSVEAQRAGRFHSGGKPDDITVLVCVI